MSSPKEQNQSFQVVIDALLDEQTPFPVQHLRRFSDLPARDLRELMAVWPKVNLERRRRLLEDLEEISEIDMLVAFYDIAKATLQDSDAQVRMLSVRLLWEDDDPGLIPTFIGMMEKDPDTQVRATAANALGFYVYEGEVENIAVDLLQTVEDSLLRATQPDQPTSLRQRALESLGFSSRPEVPDLIQAAYGEDTPDWKASALFAMGRSADKSWSETVLDQLDHPNSQVRLEAVRAAGELELTSSRSELIQIAQNDEDEDVRMAAIWSLSQIGGEEVRELLEKISDEMENDEDIDFLEDALDNLSFTEDMALYDLFEIDVDDIAGEAAEEDDANEADHQKPKRKSHKKRGAND
ncbi:MAG TPA: HEAT repeat domain-containing protein [Anaerolineaceae bacterium]|nr:HEAT repeat domain-containing protein [Anaerolineaceae bacterium]